MGKGNRSMVKLYPTIVNNSWLKLETTKPVQELIIVAMDGKKVFDKRFANFLGNTVISLPPLGNSIYIAQLYIGRQLLTYKIFIKKLMQVYKYNNYFPIIYLPVLSCRF